MVKIKKVRHGDEEITEYEVEWCDILLGIIVIALAVAFAKDLLD